MMLYGWFLLAAYGTMITFEETMDAILLETWAKVKGLLFNMTIIWNILLKQHLISLSEHI